MRRDGYGLAEHGDTVLGLLFGRVLRTSSEPREQGLQHDNREAPDTGAGYSTRRETASDAKRTSAAMRDADLIQEAADQRRHGSKQGALHSAAIVLIAREGTGGDGWRSFASACRCGSDATDTAASR
jgi:hypothetical protein